MDAARRRLDSESASPIAKGAIAIAHHQLVGPVVERISHSGCDEYVLAAVVVVVASSDAPRPERLEPGADRALTEPALTEIAIQSIPEEVGVVVFLVLREFRSLTLDETGSALVH